MAAYPHKSRTIRTKVGQSLSINFPQIIEIVGGPTRIRTWDQRIMSAFWAVTATSPAQLTPKEV